MAEKNYTIGFNIKSQKYGLRVGINVPLFVKWLEENQNERGYCNINIQERKQMGKYGETHWAALDTWQPDSTKKNEEPEQSGMAETTSQPDDLPF